MPAVPEMDPPFVALPRESLAAAALSRAADFGASHCDVRIERILTQHVQLQDAALVDAGMETDLGLAVRVVLDGTWGFAAGIALTVDEAVRVAEQAIRVAMVAKAISVEAIELADEPTYRDAIWMSSYEIDPFQVPTADKIALLADWSARLLAHPTVDHVSAGVGQVRENSFYADSHGTSTLQQRIRVEPVIEVFGADTERGILDSMRTVAAPTGRGWEYLDGDVYDWDGALAALPDQLAAKLSAPPVEAGRYDLVVDPTNLWLTIHESIGHATELDRALGYEANYAGTSFATVDKLGSLRYGSPCMHVTADRTVEHGLATIGWDDDGVQTQSWDLIRDGVLVGYQTDRRIAALMSWGRSNGCAFADSPGHTAIQRMANVSLQPGPDDTSTQDLISRVERGLYVVGDNSWSIDMQRYNFQFTAQRFIEIRDGELRGQVRDAAYQATTTDFWGSMEAVGGAGTWQLEGAFNCGKAQPGQVAPVSHGCPSALFRGVRVLNTGTEAGH
ncbi:MAG: TldD/PmbA family protein [Nocardioidaceae bacterium]